MRLIRLGSGKQRRVFQRGAVVVLFAAMLMLLIALAGLALETGQLFNRRAEIQTMTEALALAAARQLNGSSAGVSAALAAASERLSSADGVRYQYGRAQAGWNTAALSFAASAHGPWLDAAAAAGAARVGLCQSRSFPARCRPHHHAHSVYAGAIGGAASGGGGRA